jgi:hypothetical protein
MADRFSAELRAFVAERRKAGVGNDQIVREVRRSFPVVGITGELLHALGITLTAAAVKRPAVRALPRKSDGLCVYVSLVGGAAHVCGGDGYPYCADHKVRTAPVGGARWLMRGEL